MNLPQSIVDSISGLARQCNLDRMILFGSRARGTNHERSVIDVAIQGGNTVAFAVSADEDRVYLLLYIVFIGSQHKIS